MGERAIVLGGGIAGLAAAGVLSSRFEEVTVIERDHYPDGPAVRPHAPQGAHVHILLAGGLHTLTRLVPDLPGWFDEVGLPEGDLTLHLRLGFAGRWLPKVRSGVPVRPCTRPVLEHLLHRDVKRRKNVTVLTDCKVQGLTGGSSARGLTFLRGEKEEQIRADLVVDAAGRTSPSAKWVSSATSAEVEEEIVDGGVLYSSCTFKTAAPIEDDWAMLGVAPQVPSDPNSAGVMRVGPDEILCAVVAYGKPRAPTSVDEFLERMKAISVPEPYLIARDATPISDVSNFGRTQNRFRHYGRMRSSVDRLVIIGDALCSLNPRYGQGMTVAALGAEQLGHELDAYWSKHRRLDGFSASFQHRMEEVLKIPWQMALMEDKVWVETFSGKKPGPLQRLAAKGTTLFLDSVFSNVAAYIRFMRVAHMLDAPVKLLSPGFAGALLGRGGPGVAEPPGVRLRTASA